MKKLYSTIMMLATMVAALSFTACGGDDNEDDVFGGDSSDDTEYFMVFINGEDCSTKFYGAGTIGALAEKELNGTTVWPYGHMTELIKINQYDGVQFHVVAGYGTEYMKTIYPHEVGTYKVICSRGEYRTTDYPDNIGMLITGGNMRARTVTSGGVRITKVTKVKNLGLGRDYEYISEGTFDFTLTDNWDGNETKISGKFRVVM